MTTKRSTLQSLMNLFGAFAPWPTMPTMYEEDARDELMEDLIECAVPVRKLTVCSVCYDDFVEIDLS
ncbi:hypothetical protein QR680_019038 [Steinernema hermaphroditum]|uniref:Uncharacterized protein n=1 Tax=Steinernema hermaphroditum TaxID=289476 RepID=A0AA39HJR4_9BILA|nr:hypothetical protein QR680_019038 [Steinernema hermaphroditum]